MSTDLYLWDETVDPRDIVLRATAPATTATTSTGGLRAHGYTQRRSIPGKGHLHVEVLLHGEPGPVPTITGEGRAVSHVHTAAHTRGAGRARQTTPITVHVTPHSVIRTRTLVTPTAHVTARTVDPDEWLLLDLPELA